MSKNPKVSIRTHKVEKIDLKRQADFLSMYANNAAVVTNFFDMNIIFGEATGIDSSGVVTVEQRCRVTMAPAHVKILALTLVDQLNQFEEKFGKIVVPRELFPAPLHKYLDDAK